MSSRSRTGHSVDLWAEIVATEKEEQEQQPQIAVIYTRRNPRKQHVDADIKTGFSRANGPSLAPKRVSWNRSLSTRGRTSVAYHAGFCYPPQQTRPKRKTKPGLPRPKGKSVQPPNYDKERAYFEEVDSFELMEESPSPKNFSTWDTCPKNDNIVIPPLSSVLRRWLSSRNSTFSCMYPPRSLSKILETPAMFEDSESCSHNDTKTSEKVSQWCQKSTMYSLQPRYNASLITDNVCERYTGSEKNNAESVVAGNASYEDVEFAIRKLSLASETVPPYGAEREPFPVLLEVCGQSAALTLQDVFSNYCDPESILKVGEGTYGEAFKIGGTVCKIVPIDGDLKVNGEVQKRSGELLEEVILSQTLNLLRGEEGHRKNMCTWFIKTTALRVCQGSYDPSLIKAWEEWDVDNGSENDHPKEFPEKQRYVVFVLEHGGQDLESFVLFNFNEAKSLLAQVTAALAVAEAAFEFEHRDLHWGNILLTRKESETSQFTLEGRQLSVRTFGVNISIIDFTLSRINTGEDILFLDLSSDPELFEGPKGDKQSETYRKMKEVTEDCWEGSFPKTNILWLQYVVDILLLKKSFRRTSKNERDLRSWKKRLNDYDSAKEAVSDPFFEDIFTDQAL